ncbi:MAG: histidine phosphatase family protein [Roseburia sp.]|nr:histidine phosphatase family protein [Roseburia sp.]MCM1099034.1 histidine phosphatase family protein [Ruminococcus flavefaciens]
MRLIMVRHGDPDYAADSLTEKGWSEARLLVDRLAGLEVKDFYVSPLGRARDTASLTLEKMGRTAVECDWLREFPTLIQRPDVPERRSIAWDWLPEDWTADARYFDRKLWCETEVMRESGVDGMYRYVTESFDALLAEHGYVREGELYRAERANRDTLVFFCHFGVECVLLSHLIHVSPMVLWHGFCAAPSAVTTVYTEERREGKASFRVNGFGDISHLYAAGEEPAFAARFCETFDSEEERH